MVNPYISRRPEDIRSRVMNNALLSFFWRVASPAAPVPATYSPDQLRRAWRELDATWIVVDRMAYHLPMLDSIRQMLQNTLGLTRVYEDEQYVIYKANAER